MRLRCDVSGWDVSPRQRELLYLALSFNGIKNSLTRVLKVLSSTISHLESDRLLPHSVIGSVLSVHNEGAHTPHYACEVLCIPCYGYHNPHTLWTSWRRLFRDGAH